MAQKEQHINVQEMKAVLLALQAFAVYIKGHLVSLETDNIHQQTGVTPGVTHSWTLCNLAVAVAMWCAQNRVI